MKVRKPYCYFLLKKSDPGSVVDFEPEPELEQQLFCFSGTGTVMHSGSETGFGPGSNIKWNLKVKKSKIIGQLSGKQCCF
jgi:hypothetical protein